MSDDALSITSAADAEVTIRHLCAEDLPTLERLAQRDSARVPSAPLLGAESAGRLVAAISTATGEVVADPFLRTAEIVEVLRLRANQARANQAIGRPRHPGRRLLSLLRPEAGRPGVAIAPSPPGTNRWLLTLAQRTERS